MCDQSEFIVRERTEVTVYELSRILEGEQEAGVVSRQLQAMQNQRDRLLTALQSVTCK